uniref:BED-type domain-containing protein n=1 Tax=Photinus pyralis TaxID=7054 RepID=A0A1Y1MFW2_PHOPY
MVTRKPKWSIFWLVSYAYSSYGTQSVKYSLILYRCKACKCDIKITHGKGDLVKHEYTSKHTKSCVSTVGQKTITSMFAEKTKEMTTEMRAKEAEIRIAGFVAEHNLPFKIMEHLPDLMRAVCSDSAIAGIFVMKCICHSFHLCASYACEKLPEEVEKFARYVYNYFSNSPKRTEELKEFQQFANVSPVKMLHPSSTRWLSLESVVTRLLTQYGALTLYFTDKASSKKDQAAFSILHLLQQP